MNRHWHSPERFRGPRGERFWLSALAFDESGRLMVSGDRSGRIVLWQIVPQHALAKYLDTEAKARQEPEASSRVTSLQFSSDQSMLVATWDNGRARLWNTSSGARLTTGEGLTNVLSADFVGRELFIADRAETNQPGVQIRSVTTVGTERARDFKHAVNPSQVIVLGNSAGSTMRPIINAAGRRVLFEQDGVLHLLNGTQYRGGTALRPVRQGDKFIFSADGVRIVHRGLDGVVTVYSVNGESQMEVRAKPSLRGGTPEGVALSFDGTHLAVSEQGLIRVFDLSKRSERTDLAPMMINDSNGVQHIAFDGLARRLFTAGGDGALRLWSLKTGVQIGPALETHDLGEVSALAVTRDGATVATGFTTGRVSLWSLAPRLLREQTSRRAGRPLSEGEKLRFLKQDLQ